LTQEPITSDDARLSRLLARYEGERGNFREALGIEETAVPILERVLGPDHPDTVSTRKWIRHLQAREQG
jgi:hypothetical protein